VFDGATFTAIDVPSATRFTQASGINDNGQIVGFFGDDVGVLGEHGFVATPAESDRTSPVITVSASPATLSPPNGRLVTVTVTGAIAEEPKAPGCMLARIRSSTSMARSSRLAVSPSSLARSCP
jgi:hypothetical protein